MSDYDHAQAFTALHLREIVEREAPNTTEYTQLTLPDQKAMVEEIARLIPSGNVPSLVAAGLMRAPGRVISELDNRRNMTLIMQGMQTFLDKAVYQAFFVGPSAVLSAYQLMLKLAGKDPEESFPDGTWQFYVEFGLREDSARHACETTGFHEAAVTENWRLDTIDELAVWLSTAAWLLTHYDDLLACDWAEHVQLRLYADVVKDDQLTVAWAKRRPYRAPNNSADAYLDYRRDQFTSFYQASLAKLSTRQTHKIAEAWQIAQGSDRLAAYQRQMTLAAMLTPAEYCDVRQPIAAAELSIGVIHDGRYYLVEANQVQSLSMARQSAYAILRDKPKRPVATLDKALAGAHRHDQINLRRMLPAETRAELDLLRRAPILLNWDRADSNEPLSVLRRSARRGIGDHPLTIFRTEKSTVFDLSHIFFDGLWGIAVSEILTGQATRLARDWAHRAKAAVEGETIRRITLLTPALTGPSDLLSAARAARLSPEVSAETDNIQLDVLSQLRRTLHKRNAELNLTINDFLVLYRALFGQQYTPHPDIEAALKTLEMSTDVKKRQAATVVRLSLEAAQQANPSLLIPMDASSINPRERIYPTTVRNPYPELLAQHQRTLETLNMYLASSAIRRQFARRDFDRARNEYFGALGAFGSLLQQYKDMTMRGVSVSTSTIRRLGGLPNSVRRMLDGLPEHFGPVNEVIKGQEVFSNVGRVNPESSLRRFITAKDDNDKKTLAWAIMTDAAGVMHVSLRDFRPHVAELLRVDQEALAQSITQDYVDSYANGLNRFASEALQIARVRRDGTFATGDAE